MTPALTEAEQRLHAVFLAHPGETFDRDALSAAARLCPTDPLSRCVDTAVARLRRKLGAAGARIQTDFGTGYRWGPPREGRNLAPQRTPGSRFTVGDAEVDLDRLHCRRGQGALAHLTTLEARVLRRLAHTPGVAVAAEDLGPRAAIPKVVLQLRAKLGGGAITTTRGLGYALNCAPREEDHFTPLAWEAVALAGTTLELEDLVAYVRTGPLLEQVAAWGPKRAAQRSVHSPLKLPVGQGIVGAAARTGTVEYVADTRRDARYVFDLQEARSEFVVPIMVRGEVVGLFDSEATQTAAFTERQVGGLEAVARMMSASLFAASRA